MIEASTVTTKIQNINTQKRSLIKAQYQLLLIKQIADIFMTIELKQC